MQSAEDTESENQRHEAVTALMVAGFAVVIPVSLLLFLTVFSRINRVPVATGVGRGLRGLTVPVASLLALVYVGVLIGTARQEAVATALLKRQWEHEGRFLTEQTGNIWPGPIEMK